jgi:hypothetical protein
MNTNEKLKEILMRLLTQPVEQKTEPAGNMSLALEDKVTQGYDSRLEKIAHAMVKKAESGDSKAVACIIEYVGNEEWL